jgi:hypothetical protein
MIRRFIADRLRNAAVELLEDRRIARLLLGSPISSHADEAVVRSYHRYSRWRSVWTVLYGWEGKSK